MYSTNPQASTRCWNAANRTHMTPDRCTAQGPNVVADTLRQQQKRAARRAAMASASRNAMKGRNKGKRKGEGADGGGGGITWG